MVTMILVVLAPLAFGMGGSMCVMMLMNVIFLKLLLSTMSTVPSGLGIFPWLIFVTAIVRVGRKIDDIVCRMGLNPAHTGSPLGHGFMALPTMMANHAARTIVQTVAANRTGGGKTPSSGNRRSSRPGSGSASPGPNPTPSSPPPAGGGPGGSAPGKTAGTASTASTPPAGTAPKAPSPGTATSPAAASSGTPQSPPGASAPAKGTAQEGRHPQGRPLVPIPQFYLALSRQRMAKTPERPKGPAILPARLRPRNSLRVLPAVQLFPGVAKQTVTRLLICRMGRAPIRLPLVFRAHLVRRGIPQRRTTAGRNDLHPNRQEPRPLPHRRRIRLLFLPASL